MAIRLEFTYTPDDLREAAKVKPPNRRGWRGLWNQGSVGWIVYIAVALFLIVTS